MKMLDIIFYLAMLIPICMCHNRLISPTPWSPSPTKYPPCGGGLPLTAPQAYWYAGSLASIEWGVFGDGNGSLTISMDTTGGTNFTAVLSKTAVAVVGMNFFNISVPSDVVCTGINDTCSIQVASTSGWVGCTSVSILPPCTNCTPEPPPAFTCAVATGLNFCAQYNNTKIRLGAGFNSAALDIMVNESLAEYSYTMPTFLTNGTTAACQQAFKAYLCALVFPACDGDVNSCQDKCNQFKTKCGLNPTHTTLYDCGALQKCTNTFAEKIIIFSAIGVVSIIVLAFIINFVICKRVKSGYTSINHD